MSQLRNFEVTEKALRPYLRIDEDNSDAFTPIVIIDWNNVDDEGIESDVASGFLNRLSRRNRHKRFRQRIKDQPSAIRIVSEGDSWFQYPWLLDDVIDQLFDRYAIYSLGAAGDLLSEMIEQDEVVEAVADVSPHFVLLSGGGNDLVGNRRLENMLYRYEEGRKVDEYLNEQFDNLLLRIAVMYGEIVKRLVNEFPHIRVLCHSYDYVIPNNGKWLGKPMASKGIKNKRLQKNIASVLINRFDDTLLSLVDEFQGVVYRVDCRGAVDDAKLWHDELHPNDNGFKAVANRFEQEIDLMTDGLGIFRKATKRLCPGRERRVVGAADLDAVSYRRVVARRARAVVGADASVKASDSTRKKWESDICSFFEKVHRGADFLPAHFLEAGAKRAKAVCLISTPTGHGTGFLVASHDYVMTNNHVISCIELAEQSVAEFDFEAGQQSQRVGLHPERLFITSESLDFTIVACDGSMLGQISPIPLLRNSATVTREEQVNIIQHPRGRYKEIAIHNNKVIRLQDKVVQYRTDTEPGSSGSPVFNNNWDLVALHHAGWSDNGSTATNEGIRIAAIVSYLIACSRRTGEGRREATELLDLVFDSSPILGFFGLDGVVEEDISEIEIPEYRGNSEFGDIGFWNIEHFNASVSKERVERVADVFEQLSMDIMGLVEVELPAMERLVKTMSKRGTDLGFVVLDVSGQQDLAVVFDKDTSDVAIAKDIAARHQSRLNNKTSSGRRAFPRDPLFARCKVFNDSNTSFEFLMIVVHFKAFGDAQSRERRRLAAKMLAEIISEERKLVQPLPVVLGGDFNELLNNDILSVLTNTPDLFALTADDALAGAASYIGASRQSLIDHIVVSRDVRLGSIFSDDAAVIRLDRSVRDFSHKVSNHVPIVMRIVPRSVPMEVTETTN